LILTHYILLRQILSLGLTILTLDMTLTEIEKRAKKYILQFLVYSNEIN